MLDLFAFFDLPQQQDIDGSFAPHLCHLISLLFHSSGPFSTTKDLYLCLLRQLRHLLHFDPRPQCISFLNALDHCPQSASRQFVVGHSSLFLLPALLLRCPLVWHCPSFVSLATCETRLTFLSGNRSSALHRALLLPDFSEFAVCSVVTAFIVTISASALAMPSAILFTVATAFSNEEHLPSTEEFCLRPTLLRDPQLLSTTLLSHTLRCSRHCCQLA